MSKIERINECYEYLRSIGKIHTKKDLCDLLNIAPSNLTKAFKGEPRYLTDGFLRRFCAAFDGLLSEEWLLTGEGSMLIEDSIVPESTTVDQDDDEKAELIKIIEELRKENSRLVETNERLSRVVDRLLDEKESGRTAI